MSEYDKPACIEYYENGKVLDERWYKGDEYHRDGDKPAWVFTTITARLSVKCGIRMGFL